MMKPRMTIFTFPKSFCENPALLFFSVVVLLIVSTGDVCAITTEGLQEPMTKLKSEVFDWMFAVKIAAIAAGGVFSMVKQSLTPFGIGAGITAALALFDKILSSSVSGALV